MRNTLSIVIPTKNCQDDIQACLESVKWADEIIIIDGFSTDNTIDICKKYTDKIIQYKHQGSYYGVGEEERNLGIDRAKCDWILQMDSDEIVTEGFKKSFQEILDKGTEFNAFKFRRKNYFLGHWMQHGGWYHYSLHLFKRGKARYEGNIHETLVVDGKVGILEADIEHYPFKNISQFISRHNSYSDREAKMILEKQGVLSDKVIAYNLKIRPIKLFWKFYFKKKGYKEGVYGLIFSILFAWVHFLNWVKYWEMIKTPKDKQG